MILIGFMGAGKTTLAKEIEKRTGTKYIDLDEYIVKKHKMSIPDIFNKYGELNFREKEYEALTEVIQKNCVIATGGGIVTYSKSLTLLKESRTHVIFLDAPFDVLYSRIKNDINRPHAKNSYEKILSLYNSRKNLYESVADDIINTEHTLDELFHNFY